MKKNYPSKTVFLDTNVLLNVLLVREGEESARQILEMGAKRQLRICFSSLTVANEAYIARKAYPKSELMEVFQLYLKKYVILPNNDMGIMFAMNSDCPDFEDALQIACAEAELCDAIITCNTSHFAPYTDIPVYTPEDFLKKICRKV